MKTVVTHLSPDLDAIASTWLIKRYRPHWDDADIVFVPHEKTMDGKGPDEDPDVMTVDTGFGTFDHHQSDGYLSATKLVFDYLNGEGYIRSKDIAAVERIVDFVTMIDNFGEVEFPSPDADVYDFAVHQLIFGIHANVPDDHRLTEKIFEIIDGMLVVMKNKISAEEDLKKGIIFETAWGKTVAMESKNEEALKLALKSGYRVAIRKDTDNNFLKIKAYPVETIDLTELRELLQTADPKATWYLKGSKRIIMNGSARNPNALPTSLTLTKVIEIIKKIQ